MISDTLASVRLDGEKWILSPTDLSEFLACEHLTNSKVRAWRDERPKLPTADDPHTAIVKRRGDEHESEQIAILEAEAGEKAVDLSISYEDRPKTAEEMAQAAERTLEAMRNGPKLITQAPIFDSDSPWFGSAEGSEAPDPEDPGAADFGFVDALRRVDGVESALGSYCYEIIEIKLAREPRPKFVHQVSLYSRALARMQGVEPAEALLILGNGNKYEVNISRFRAAHTQAESRLRDFVENPPPPARVPEPVTHCQLCQLNDECSKARIEADHLSLVANLSSTTRDLVEEAGITTMTALAESEASPSPKIAGDMWQRVRTQAALQVESRSTGEPRHQNREPQPGLGYAALPEADNADIFFDLEGDPYEFSEGIEYLWGWCDAGGKYDCIWAHDEAEEKEALERFVDHAYSTWQENPGMHIYFYAPHEKSKLGSLTVKYATRDEQLDEMLRAGVLVDLLSVVRNAIQVGEESYSLKKLERHHGFERTEEKVRGGGGSIVAYEKFLVLSREGNESDADEFLSQIREYNCDDCLSTLSLRNWLLKTTKPAAQVQWPEADMEFKPNEPAAAPDWLEEVRYLIEGLTADIPDSPDYDTDDDRARRLLASLLLYHRREENVNFWRYFELLDMSVDDLTEELDCVGPLTFDDSFEPIEVKSSLAYRFNFPPQEVKWEGTGPLKHEDGKPVRIHEFGDDWVTLLVGKKEPRPQTAGLISGLPFPSKEIRLALQDVAAAVISGKTTEFAASLGLLARSAPVGKSKQLGFTTETLCEDTVELAPGAFPVQGPPGTGKTHNGAEMIARALAENKRVGVSAFSHKAIQNLLAKVEAYAIKHDVELNGGYKAGDSYKDDWESEPHPLIKVEADLTDPALNLVAGTVYALSSVKMRESVDILFIDEAGQYPLANAVAAGTATRGAIVLLGDPQQLAQVRRAKHPDGAEVSALEHLIFRRAKRPDGEGVPALAPLILPAKTIDRDRGVLLDESWRMHPEICKFDSWLSYEERLRSRPDCADRLVSASGKVTGAGLRIIEVEHTGRSQHSKEEAALIAELCSELLSGNSTVTGPDDDRVITTRPLTPEDIMVVAPYNLAVSAIREAVPNGVAVGTVDKFQGQEAAVVFYAMTSSSAEDAPRGMGFLFDDHRFNVAISRAECLSIVVINPRLLDAPARTIEQLELINNICEYRTVATPIEV